MTEEPNMPEKDAEVQPETPNPRSPADQRRDNEEVFKEYVESHEEAAKGPRSEQ